MDRESIKRMGSSLRVFSTVQSLLKMTDDQLAEMPKEVMIACAPNEIVYVWDKLPERYREDSDLQKYLFCTEHYNTENGESDERDGPPVRKLFCCFCKMEDVNVANKNDIDLSPIDEQKNSVTASCCNQ